VAEQRVGLVEVGGERVAQRGDEVVERPVGALRVARAAPRQLHGPDVDVVEHPVPAAEDRARPARVRQRHQAE
jgi:hypothetical protein